MIGACLFSMLFLMLTIGVPIAISLGISSIVTIIIFEPRIVLEIIPQRIFTATDNYVFMAIPFFMLSGELMLSGGISNKLIEFVKSLMCRIPGSLACVTTGASAFFGALSGSNPATVAAIGGIMVPSMVKDGYIPQRAAAVAASSGTLGVIIPPSIPMVTYAVVGGISVKSLFIGGIIPGLMLTVALVITDIILCGKHDKNLKTTFSWKRVWTTFKDAILALLMPTIILGGIYSGIFTPTEAAAVSAVYAFIISKFVYKTLTWLEFRKLTIKAAINASIVLFVVSLASPFAWLLTSSGVPKLISEFALGIFNSKILTIFMMNLILLFLGMLLDTISIILIMTPILIPMALQLGIDPVALGIIIVVNTSIGMITPPMATNLFVACRISGVSLEQVSYSILPFMAVECVVLFIISYTPDLLIWLPNVLK